MAYLTRMLPYIYLLAIMMILSSTLRGAGQAVIPLFFRCRSGWQSASLLPLRSLLRAR